MPHFLTAPATGGPVIISLTSEPKTFNKLGCADRTRLINKLVEKVGQLKPGTKWAERGDLFVYPSISDQKHAILALTSIMEFTISCALPRQDNDLKGVISKVPAIYTDDELLENLQDQGVLEVRRFVTTGAGGESIRLLSVSLTFDRNQMAQLPAEVRVVGEMFRVRPYIPSPMQCKWCWKFGHTKNRCPDAEKKPCCRRCAGPHELNQGDCRNKTCCPNCQADDHLAGSMQYRVYRSSTENIRLAYEKGIPINEASKVREADKSREPKQRAWADVARAPPTSSDSQELEEMRRRMAEMETRMKPVELKVQTVPQIQMAVKKLEEKVVGMEKGLRAAVKEELESGMTAMGNHLAGQMNDNFAKMLKELKKTQPTPKPTQPPASNQALSTGIKLANNLASSGSQTEKPMSSGGGNSNAGGSSNKDNPRQSPLGGKK